VKRRLRILVLAVLAILPMFVKRTLYRWLFGYRIGRGVRIGVAFIDCRNLTIGDGTTIGHGTIFWRCGEVRIGRQVVIGALNLFRGGVALQLEDYAMILRLNVINAIIEPDFTRPPDSTFRLGYGSVLTAEHRIDFTDRVTIGRRSILGGRNSSIWTHNRRDGQPVMVGDFCYIGSEIRMAPGSSIPSRSIVGLASVITGKIEVEAHLIAGVPAKPRRVLNESDLVLIYDKTRRDLPDEECDQPATFNSGVAGIEAAQVDLGRLTDKRR
jgi:acetyltransferase-like isoleucine patch superfamily enzyme